MAKILPIEDKAHIRDEATAWLRFEGYEAIKTANVLKSSPAATEIGTGLITIMPELASVR